MSDIVREFIKAVPVGTVCNYEHYQLVLRELEELERLASIGLEFELSLIEKEE